jgi:hypothetical protein
MSGNPAAAKKSAIPLSKVLREILSRVAMDIRPSAVPSAKRLNNDPRNEDLLGSYTSQAALLGGEYGKPSSIGKDGSRDHSFHEPK